MRDYFADFFSDQSGAITVDFVVLTAAICTMGLVVVGNFSQGATDLANRVEANMDERLPTN